MARDYLTWCEALGDECDEAEALVKVDLDQRNDPHTIFTLPGLAGDGIHTWNVRQADSHKVMSEVVDSNLP